jgi:hypothetical protein
MEYHVAVKENGDAFLVLSEKSKAPLRRGSVD